MTKKYVFRKGLVIGIIILFVGASVVPSISGNVEEKNKTNIDIDPTLDEHIIKESFADNNINNEKNERYRDTQPTIFNGGNSKGWSITEVISTESTNWSWRPSLMVDSGDVVHVTWMDYTDYGGSGQDWDIFYKYKNGDDSWSATEVVSTESTEDSWRPSLMVDTDGVVHVTWFDLTDYSGSGIDNDIFYKYKNGGGSWSATEVVSTESTEDSYRPSLMVDTGGVVHVAWFDLTDYSGSGQDWDIFYKYKNGDGSWSATEVVSTESTEDSGYPSLMVDSDSVVHVTWQDHTEYGGSGGDWDIFYKYKNGGDSWSATEVVSTESGYLSEYPSLMVDTDGVVHVAWKDKTDYGGSGIDNDIFYKYKNGGDSWSATEVVSTESTNHSWYPSLMVDTDGVVHVTWMDYTDYGGSGIDNDIFYKYKSSGNQPPNKPDINGPTSGKTGTSYNYTFISIDPGEDIVQFFIDWGDGDTEWTEFVASGTPVTRSHIWNEKSTYEIKAKAKDTDDYESEWGTLTVSMPRSRLLTNSLFMRLLERLPNAFPILYQLLQRFLLF